mmetsp:Transcript_1345/g.2823  ORF Transcript_1345/g.2823 Transcript_1345/m.2823 type:complete len:203 (-) Transcript_1345:37-645(-)
MLCLGSELGKDGGSPRVGGLLGRRKVFRDDSVLGNQRESLGPGHHGRLHGEAECLCELAGSVAQKENSRVGSPGGAPPGLHDKVVVGGNANDEIDSPLCQFVAGGDKTGQVRLGAAGGKGAGDSKDDDLFSGNELGNVDVVLSAKLGEALLEDDRGDGVAGLDFLDFGVCHDAAVVGAGGCERRRRRRRERILDLECVGGLG